MALSFVGLLGVVGAGIDLGYGYAHRREVQNAADTAAVAGAVALGRHYQYAYVGSGYTLGGLTDATDATIKQDLQYAAASSVPPFPEPGTSPTWPVGTRVVRSADRQARRP